MKRMIFVIFISFFTFLVGCQNNGKELISEDTSEYAVESESYSVGVEGYAGFDEEASSESYSVEVGEYSGFDEAANTEIGEIDFSDQRMVSYQANMNVDVENVTESIGYIQELASRYNGYLVESSYTESKTDPNASLVFKIPDSSFTDFMEEVSNHVRAVTFQEIYTQDMTEEYVDLDSRLSSKQAVEKRLLQFLEDAEDTENVLAISKELAKTQEEIERILGRMRYIENKVIYSTVYLYLKEDLVRIGTLQGEGELNTWQKAKKLFIDTVNFVLSLFSTVIVFLIGLSPVMIPLIILSLLIWLKRKRSRT